MIKKSIICFFSIALCYSLLIAIIPYQGIGTNQWQENQIRAQRFLYENESDTIIVGTSLSARILFDSIRSVSSCAFSACVVEDGLRLLLYKEHKPHYVLIETNYILRYSNSELLKANTQGPLSILRNFMPILREHYSPISLVGSFCMQGALAPTKSVDMERLKRSIRNRISDDYTHYLSEEQLLERMNTIRSLVRQLESYGVKIVLFEMPINAGLKHTPSNDQTRHAVFHMFPKHKYVCLPNDTCSYLTNDGEHLDAAGQRQFTHYLKELLVKTKL